LRASHSGRSEIQFILATHPTPGSLVGFTAGSLVATATVGSFYLLNTISPRTRTNHRWCFWLAAGWGSPSHGDSEVGHPLAHPRSRVAEIVPTDRLGVVPVLC